MALADPPWDFSPPSFLETSSPKLPSWRPPRSRTRWGQSPPPQQRSDGEEEEELAGFSSEMVYTGIRVHLAIGVVAMELEKNPEGKLS